MRKQSIFHVKTKLPSYLTRKSTYVNVILCLSSLAHIDGWHHKGTISTKAVFEQIENREDHMSNYVDIRHLCGQHRHLSTTIYWQNHDNANNLNKTRPSVQLRKWRLTLISVSLRWDPDDVPHCRILPPDKTEWRLISATLCGRRRCFVTDQLWLMTHIWEEEEEEEEEDYKQCKLNLMKQKPGSGHLLCHPTRKRIRSILLFRGPTIMSNTLQRHRTELNKKQKQKQQNRRQSVVAGR